MLFGYARVSTQEQAAEGTTSLDEQDRAIQGYGMMKGISAFDLQVFTDAGISGAMALNLRPAGAELMEAVKSGDTIVATKLDRMFRDSLDALNCFVKFKERGIDLVLLEFGIDPITDDKNLMGKVMYTVIAAFADWDRQNIANRMQKGKEAKRRNGGHAGGRAPYGYRIEGSKRDARLVPDSREIEIIKTVDSMRRKPPNIITRYLNEKGYPTRSGKPWQQVQIERILKGLPDAGTSTAH